MVGFSCARSGHGFYPNCRKQPTRPFRRCAFLEDHTLPKKGLPSYGREAKSCGNPLTDLEAHRLSEALGHDPLLLGLIDPRYIWDATGERPVILGIIEGFIEGQLARLAQGGGQRFAVSDYEDALLDLADRMLMERELAPTWRTIRSWFPPSSGGGLDRCDRSVPTGRSLTSSAKAEKRCSTSVTTAYRVPSWRQL